MIEFLNADNLKVDWRSRLTGKRVHIVTSPPYNLGKPYKGVSDRQPEAKWFGDIHQLFIEFSRLDVLHTSSCWVNCNRRLRDLLASTYPIHQEFMWVSSITEKSEDGAEVSRGRYSPVESPDKTHKCFEWVLHLEIGGNFTIREIDRYSPPLGVPYADESNIDRFKHGRTTRCRGDVWFIPHDHNASRLHPCPFPVDLARFCLSASRAEHTDTVVDPWFGIGSAAVAADRLGANFIGSELSEEYVKIAAARIRADRERAQK